MVNRICVKAVVSGRVQGVGFRYHTAHEGLKLSLSGYARNESNGSVTVMICGEKAQVVKLLTWLEKGPNTAHVTSLEYQEEAWQHIEGFAIR